MLVKKGPIGKNFTQISNSVINMTNISDGAFRLYVYLSSCSASFKIWDTVICTKLNISESALYRRKRELKDSGLISTEQLAPRVHMLYMGNGNMSANAVKAYWFNREEGNLV